VSGWVGKVALRGYGGSSKDHANSDLGMVLGGHKPCQLYTWHGSWRGVSYIG
jgi:hypothetical protein